MEIVEILVRYRQAFVNGLTVTVKLFFFSGAVGISVGTVLGIASSYRPRSIGAVLRAGSFLLASVPILVFLFVLHFPVQAVLGVVIDPFVTACVALGVFNTFAVAQIVRTALDDFPQQYIIVAQICGLTTKDTVFQIQVPLVLRQIIPPLLNSQVVLLQSTLFASLISVEELFRVAQRINAQVYKPVEIFSALALFFILVCLPLNLLAFWLRGRYTRSYSER